MTRRPPEVASAALVLAGAAAARVGELRGLPPHGTTPDDDASGVPLDTR